MEHLPGGAGDDVPVHGEGPIFEIVNVVADAIDDVGGLAGFAAEALDLGEAGDAGLDEAAKAVGEGDFAKLDVVLDHVGAGADDAHFAAEDVDELGEFIEAEAAEPAAKGEDAGVELGGLEGVVRVVDAHGAKFEDVEGLEADAGAALAEEEGPGGLGALEDGDEEAEDGEDEGDDWEGDGDVEDALEDAVEGALEGLFAEADEADAAVFKEEDWAIEVFGDVFLDVVDDEEADAELLALFADVGGVGDGVGHLEEDDLGGTGGVGEAVEFGDGADDGPREIGPGLGVVGDETDDIDAVLGFAGDPRHHAPSVGGSAEEECGFAPRGVEKLCGDEAGKGGVQRGEGAVEDGDEREKKDARDGGVLLRDEKEHEDAEDGERLPEGKAKDADEVELEEIGVVEL